MAPAAAMACGAFSFAILLPMSSASALNARRQIEMTAVGFNDERFPLGTSEVSLGEQAQDLAVSTGEDFRPKVRSEPENL